MRLRFTNEGWEIWETAGLDQGGRAISSLIAETSFRTDPPWRQLRGNSKFSLVNSHTNTTRIGWHLWEIDLRFVPGLPPGWFLIFNL